MWLYLKCWSFLVFQEEFQLLAEYRLVHHGHSPGAVWQDQRVWHGAPSFLQVRLFGSLCFLSFQVFMVERESRGCGLLATPGDPTVSFLILFFKQYVYKWYGIILIVYNVKLLGCTVLHSLYLLHPGRVILLLLMFCHIGFLGGFFLIQFDGLWKEDAVCYTNCKAITTLTGQINHILWANSQLVAYGHVSKCWGLHESLLLYCYINCTWHWNAENY